MSGLKIEKAACIGCGVCVNACLYGALTLDTENTVAVDAGACALCGACVSECPAGALALDGGKEARADKADYHGVWVYAEQWQGAIHASAYELLSEARQLAADLGETLSAVLIGHDMAAGARALADYGAAEVYLLDAPALATPDDETYAHLLARLVKERKPAVVLYGATAFGRSLAPRVAAALQTGLTADCTALAIDREQKLLQQTRPAFGGNVMATILCPEHRPQMATVRPKVFKKSPPEQSAAGTIIPIMPDLSGFAIKSRILEVVDFVSNELRVEDAEIVVAGGAGCATPETFALVRQLAAMLGGCVGASRAAVDLGYAGHAAQVGQTGKVIAPKLYIACGIAGAIQHLVGMENAEFIIAINKDPDAAILQIADIGIVGDVEEVLPELIRQLKIQATA